MTTLPQNSALRMPRPAPAGGPSAAGGAPPNSGLTGADVVRVLRANAPLLVALLVVSGVTGYFVNTYLAGHASRYTARGLCEIRMETDELTGLQRAMGSNDILIEQRTQVQNLRNEALFSRVLQDDGSPIRNTSWFRSFGGDPKQARQSLSKNFTATAIPDTRLVMAEMQYSVPEDTRTIVEAIVQKYIDDQLTQQNDEQFRVQGQLSAMRTRYEADLRNTQADMKSLAEDISRRGLNSGPAGSGVAPAYVKLDAVTRKYAEASDQLTSLNTELNNFEKSQQNGEQEYPKLLSMVEKDDAVQGMARQLREMKNNLEQDPKFGSQSPAIRELTDRIEKTEKSLASLRKQKLAEYRQTYTDSLRGAKADLQAQVDAYKKELDIATAEVNSGQALVQKYRTLEEKETTASGALKDVVAAIDRNARGANSKPTLQWTSGGKPIVPDVPSFPNLPVTMSLAITIGLVLGLTIAFARELTDDTIRSPRDVAKVGPIPVLGQISHEDDDPQAAGSRLPLLIADAPHSMTAEQLRQLRTRLQQASSLDTTRSLLVTSPNPGDGKTTIAANLAAGLALVGRRILFVDANFRRPELHKLFGVDNAQGFATALASPEQVSSLAKPTKIPNLFVLPSGPKLANSTEILEGANLHEFIEKALESYDHVIFDSGPLLFASETVAMAPRVDGVVTVLRARGSTRGVLGRVKETLRQLKAESLGVVINGVRSHGGGYYSRNMKTFYEYASNGQA